MNKPSYIVFYMELMINVLDRSINCVYKTQTFDVIYCIYIIKILTASHYSFSYSL